MESWRQGIFQTIKFNTATRDVATCFLSAETYHFPEIRFIRAYNLIPKNCDFE